MDQFKQYNEVRITQQTRMIPITLSSRHLNLPAFIKTSMDSNSSPIEINRTFVCYQEKK